MKNDKNINDAELRQLYKSEMNSVAFSSDFVSRTVAALKTEAHNDLDRNMIEHKPAGGSKIRLIRTVLISAAACFICVFAIRVVMDEKDRPEVQQVTETVTTTTTTAATTTPEIIEEIGEFEPFAATPELYPDGTYIAADPDAISTFVSESNVTTVTVTSVNDTTTVTYTTASQTSGGQKTEKPSEDTGNGDKSERNTTGGAPDGGTEGDVPADDDSVGGVSNDDADASRENIVRDDTDAGVEEDAADDAEVTEEESVEEEAPAAEDADEDGEEALVSPILDNGISLRGFENLSGYTGSITFIPEAALQKTISEMKAAALAKVLFDTLGNEFVADRNSVSGDSPELSLVLSGTYDSFTIVLYKNALTISYTTPDGSIYRYGANLTADRHDAIFKALYIAVYSEHEYELFIAMESGK
jgi:hypothetical protein